VRADSLSFEVVDVFTDRAFAGNPLAVVLDADALSTEQLQSLAREFNLSETAFPMAADREGADYRLRIFTPATELPFAGHPTLGTAFVLAGPLQLIELKIETGNGTVAVELEREGARIVFGRMRQPEPSIASFDRADEALAALGGVEPVLPVELYDNGVPHVLVALESKEAVAALTPDQGRLLELGRFGFNCFAGDGRSWKTRMFGPGLGVAEDPATGSAAGPIALHLAKHGRIAFGDEIELVQGEAILRRSVLYATAHEFQL